MNEQPQLMFYKENENGIAPKRNHETDAGYDLFASESVTIKANSEGYVPIGIKLTVSDGWWYSISTRGTLSYKKLIVSSNPVFDSGFTFDHTILLFNNSDKDITIEKGVNFCQVILHKKRDAEIIELSKEQFENIADHHERGNKCGWKRNEDKMDISSPNIENVNDVQNKMFFGKTITVFTSTNCAPCELIKPILHEINNEDNGVDVYYVNSEKSPELFVDFDIISTPSLLMHIDGELVRAIYGINEVSKNTLLNNFK